MELNLFEVGLLIDYYENEFARLQTRYDLVRLSADEYDEDLKNSQLMRIEDKKRRIKERIKELCVFEKKTD
nr:MAG TPA: hypothetical protein [Caudoviricetes sp.]